MKEIKVFAPASVANVGCGFDILGFALEKPGDELILKKVNAPGVRITNLTPYQQIPLNPAENCAGMAILAFLKALGTRQGVEIVLTRKIKPGSGLGSSAASAAAAVYAANVLFETPFSDQDLLKFGMLGEAVASKAEHADNLAPSLLGGFILIRSYAPLDIVKLPYPSNLYCAIALPDIEIKTVEARSILKKEVEFKKAITQWGNVAGLVAGLASGDFGLIGRSLQDVIVEPLRATLIPGYDKVKESAMNSGALGCNISGAGPAVFALCHDPTIAENVAHAMKIAFQSQNIRCEKYISLINHSGAITIN